MSTGGATWDTAGDFEPGGSNTFDVSGSSDEAPLYDLAWWKYTPTSPGVLEVAGDMRTRVYRGTDADRIEEAGASGFDNGWVLREGVEYRILAYRILTDTPAVTYDVGGTFTRYTASPWNDSLQDDPDNYLIISDGVMVDANPNPGYSSAFMPEWTDDIIRDSQARRGFWRAMETLGGADVHGAATCCIGHADNGDDAIQSWNTATTGDAGTTPPVCRTLETGAATDQTSRSSISAGLEHLSGQFLVAASETAIFQGPSYGLFFLPVRDHLNPWGTLYGFSIDPVDYGYPADAIVEWENPTVDLVRVEVTDGDPLDPGTAPLTTGWYLNDAIAPVWEDGFSGPWRKGPPGLDPGVTNRPHLFWTYDDGDVTWHEIPDSDGWDGHEWHEDYAGSEQSGADGVILSWPFAAVPGEGDPSGRLARPAVKFVLQAQRFRFVYPPTYNPAPRRIIQRKKDGLVGSGGQTVGGRKATGIGARTIGRQL